LGRDALPVKRGQGTMTLDKLKLKKLGESMQVQFTKEQECIMLEHFGTGPEPYEWTEQDIFMHIQNFLGCGEFVKKMQNNEKSILPLSVYF
jgi:hypothetical protein